MGIGDGVKLGTNFPGGVMKGTSASLPTIFGETGDLAQRTLLSSLSSLEDEGPLPDELRTLGAARSEGEGFKAMLAEAIGRHAPAGELNEATLRALLQRVDYQPVPLDDPASLQTLGEKIAAARAGDGTLGPGSAATLTERHGRRMARMNTPTRPFLEVRLVGRGSTGGMR